MHRIVWCAVLAFCVALSSTLIANSQTNLRIRGTTESVDGQYLTIRMPDGSSARVLISDNARVVEIADSSIDEIIPGLTVAVTALSQPDGSQKALEVSIFTEPSRGSGDGARPRELLPNSTMTSGIVDAKVASVDGDVLTLKYKGGEKRVTLAANTLIFTYAITDVKQIKPGMKILVANAAKQADGTYLALQITVSKPANDPALSKNTGCRITSAGVSCGALSDPQRLADNLGKKLREVQGRYNKPGTLFLGSSTPIQYVIPTTGQSVDGMFKGFPGDVTTTKVQVAENVSAYLTGPKDMIEITLRGEPMRAITNASPVSWVWDVRPLKPGQAQVTLEVFSHIKIDGEDHKAQVRVLQDTWDMKAEGLEWIKYEISQIEPVQAFLFALISGIGGTLAYFGLKGGQPNNSDDSLS